MKAIIYARVSTEDQAEEGYSLASQVSAARKLAAAHGAEVADSDEFADSVSGTTLDRPGLKRVRELVATGQYRRLYVYELDRLSRRASHQFALWEELDEAGVELWEVKTNRRAEAGPLRGIMAVLAEEERSKILERTKRGKRQKATEGRPVGVGPAPYGYRWVGAGKEKQLEVDPDTSPWLVWLFEQYASGKYGAELAAELSAMGVPTPGDVLGRRKNRYAWRKPGQWAPNSIYNLLKRRLYTGLWTHYPKTEDPVVVQIPALIPDDLFRRVRERIDASRITSKRNATRSREFLIARRFRCYCGAAMLSWWSDKAKSPPRYRCNNSLPRGGKRCSAPTIKQQLADELTWRLIIDYELDPELLKAARYRQNEEVAEKSADYAQREEKVRSRLVELDQREGRLDDAYEYGDIDRDSYRERKNRLREDRKEADDLLRQIKATAAKQHTPEEIESEAQFLARLQEGARNLTSEERVFVAERLGVWARYVKNEDGLHIAVTLLGYEEPRFLINVETSAVTELRQSL